MYIYPLFYVSAVAMTLNPDCVLAFPSQLHAIFSKPNANIFISHAFKGKRVKFNDTLPMKTIC